MAKKRKRSKKGNIKALGGKGNKYAATLKMTKGLDCGTTGRKQALKAVKHGASPRAAVRRFCRLF